MRVLAAVLVVAALLWWLLQDDESARRDRSGIAAESEEVGTDREAAEQPQEANPPATASETENETATNRPRPIWRGRVQVLGRADAPLAGVFFKSHPPLLTFSRATDDLGWTDWTSRRPVPPGLVIIDSFVVHKHPVEVPVTTVRFPNLIPLEVEFLDVQTGAVLEAGSVALSTDRGKTVHGKNERTILHAPIIPGQVCDFLLRLVPPKGTTGEFGLQEPVRCYVSRRAHAAHLRIPVWPLMTLTLEFRDRNGALAPGVQVDSIVRQDRSLWFEAARSDSAGRAEVKGLPYMRGALLRIRAGGIEYRVRIRRQAQYATLYRQRGRTIPPQPPSKPIVVEPRPQGTASLVVEARWLDREWAIDCPLAVISGTTVRTVRTGAETGVARFEQIPEGELRVVARDPALAYEERGLSLRDGGKMTITLGPAQGRSLTIVAQNRRPAPGARITASSWHGTIAPPLRHGVQELAAVTGSGGAFDWHGFPTAAFELAASRGQVTGTGRIGRGGRSDSVTLTLRWRYR